MGATVTCQKAAAAFRSPSGIPIYVLSESTYEKNVCPHTPSWACCYVGGIQGALQRLFGYAAVCEGGLLQTRRGKTSPEAYITGWLRCLAAPAAMPDLAVSLSSGVSYLDAISPGRLADAAALLASHGLGEASRTLQAGGRAELRLHRDADAVAALCDTRIAAPHRLLPIAWVPSQLATDPGLGYVPAPLARAAARPPAVLRLDTYDHLMQAEDGAWHHAGWAYTIVGRHVEQAWEAELAAPGQYRTSIAALRHAVANAPPIPAGTQVLVHGVDGMDQPTQRDWTAIAAHHPATATEAGWLLPVTPGLPSRLVHSIGRKHLTWLVPPLDAPPQARLFPLDGPRRPTASA